MRLTQLAGDCFLIETNQGAVLALLKQNMGSDLFSDRGDLLSQISRIHDLKALIVSPQVDFSDPLIGEVMEQFPKARILLLGTEGKRLQSSNARNIEFGRVHHLPAFQFLRVHPFLFMGVPIRWGGKSEGFILCWQDKQIWFQWPSPPNPEVMLATRVFCGHPITAAYVPVMEGSTANHPHEDSIWIQAALGARAQEIHLSGPQSDIDRVRESLLKLDSRLRIYSVNTHQSRWYKSSFISGSSFALPSRDFARSALSSALSSRQKKLSILSHSPFPLSKGSTSLGQTKRPSQSSNLFPSPLSQSNALPSSRYTLEEERRFLARLIEVEFHSQILKILAEEIPGPYQALADLRAILQLRIEISDGSILDWHFSRWFPRCEIGFGLHPEATHIFAYQAHQVLDFARGLTSHLTFERRQTLRDISLDISARNSHDDRRLFCYHSFRSDAESFEWHPLYQLKKIWQNSLANPFLTFKEKDRLLYRL